MSERAAKLARIAGWEHWQVDNDDCEYPTRPGHWSELDPEHSVDDALALAECLWPKWVWHLSIHTESKWKWGFEADSDEGFYDGYGDTPALAICAAIEAAGKE